MIFFAELIYFIVIGCKLTFIVVQVDGVKLTAINDSVHVIQLYKELKNNNAPVTLDTQDWDQICEDITHSGFFHWVGLIPIDLGKNYSKSHLYDLREFNVGNLHTFTEYVFPCLLQEKFTINTLVPVYVSKEYNLNQNGCPYTPGRFIFGNLMPEHSRSYYFMMLAEVPASAYEEPGFSVELYYLQLRKYIEPAKNNEIDPLCKIISNKIEDSNNQHYRLCVSVSRSSYFKDKNRYPGQVAYPCAEREVSFRTDDAKNEAGKKSYRERMIHCHSGYVQPREGENLLYISRAYNSNVIFAYSYDRSDGRIYLENLSTGVRIVDELNSFEFVED